MKTNKKVSIIISSFDGYKDLWEPLEESYMKFWNDCTYDCYVLTNFEHPHFDSFKYISIGKDKSWSDMLRKALKKIKSDYILLTFDDLFLYKNINNKKVDYYIHYAIQNNLNYFQLYPSVSKNEKVVENIVKKEKNSKYRNATVWSLWKKDVLLDLLKDNESAWEFEVEGSKRSNKYNDFYCVIKPVIPYVNGVVKGKWVPSAIKILNKNGIDIDLESRNVMSFIEYITFKFKDILYDLYKLFLFR